MGRKRSDSQPTGFGLLLKRFREKAGISQQELSARASCSLFTVSKIEREEQEPTWPLVLALAAALRVGVEQFVATSPVVGEGTTETHSLGAVTPTPEPPTPAKRGRPRKPRAGEGDALPPPGTGEGKKGKAKKIKAKVTEVIHPEAVFMVHGFGHTLPVESRALGKGVADNAFMQGGLEVWDQAGGGMAMQEHFVSVNKISKPTSGQR